MITYLDVLDALMKTSDHVYGKIYLDMLVEIAETNRSVQDVLKAIQLNPPFDKLIYLKPKNGRGSWRRRATTYDDPSDAQIAVKAVFGAVMSGASGSFGCVERRDGTKIPLGCVEAGRVMRESDFSKIAGSKKRYRETIRKIIGR